MSGSSEQVKSDQRVLKLSEEGYAVQRKLISGARGFRTTLRQEREVLEKVKGILASLADSSAASQIREVDGQILVLNELDRELVRIVKAVVRPEVGLALVRNDEKAVWEKRIKELMDVDAARRFHAVRVQGPRVERLKRQINDCEGRHGDAVLFIAEFLSQLTSDSASGLQSLWRFHTDDNAIWLYHHHPTEKYKCLYFRISVTRNGTGLVVSLETYVPFGSFNDPAPYKMAESRVLNRLGWVSTKVTDESFNASNTVNLSQTLSSSYGETLGSAVNLSESTSRGSSTSEGTTESLADSSSFGESTNWSDTWSSTYSNVNSNSSGGSKGGGSTHTTGSTHTIGTSRQRSAQETESKTTGTTESIGVSLGLSLAECRGLSRAEGRSFQVSHWNYGIDLGESAKTHIEQWKGTHSDAAQIYDGVLDMFEQMSDQLADHLRALSTGGTARKEVPELAEQLRHHLVFEDLRGIRRPSGQLQVEPEVGGSRSDLADASVPIPTTGRSGRGGGSASERVDDRARRE